MSESKGSFANPGPAGLVALAMACFTFFALLTGKVDHSCIPLLGFWLLGGCLVQLIVGIIELKDGNILGGNVFTFFCAFFMFTSGANMLLKFWAATHGIVIDARIDGWAWLSLSIALTLWTPGYLVTAPKSLSTAVAALIPAVWIISFSDMKVLGATWAPIAGYFMLLAGIFGLYTASAIILNQTYGKTVLPIGIKPFIKKQPS